jgi:hypothetical protein
VPSEFVGPDEINDGALNIFYGSASGLGPKSSTIWTSFSFGLQPEDAPEIGYGLEAG